MKVPKARRLPSGSWFCRVRVDGKDISITRETEKQAVAEAMAIKEGIERVKEKPENITLRDAYQRYIKAKEGTLSPSTIAGYQRLAKHTMQGIMDLKLNRLTSEKIQREISAMSKDGKSPKYIANANGLLYGVLGMFYKDFSYKVTLPKRKKAKPIRPKESDIKAIADAVRGYAVELPTLLAMWMGLRMSEILGLTWDCIEGNNLHIKQAKVDEGFKDCTKTEEGDRIIPIPPYIKQLFDNLPHKSDFIFPVTRGSIYDSFQKYTSRAGIQHYRFHDLRHLNTTVQLLLGIDNEAIMERNGWSTDDMIQRVYGHTSDERKTLAANVIDEYFASQIGNELATDENDTQKSV